MNYILLSVISYNIKCDNFIIESHGRQVGNGTLC